MHKIPVISGVTLLAHIKDIRQVLDGKPGSFERFRNDHFHFTDQDSGRIDHYTGTHHEIYTTPEGEFGIAIHASDHIDRESQAAFLVVILYLLQPGISPIRIAEVSYFTDLDRGTFRSIRHSDQKNEFATVEELELVSVQVLKFVKGVVRAIE